MAGEGYEKILPPVHFSKRNSVPAKCLRKIKIANQLS
jgi:hypothetical protein